MAIDMSFAVFIATYVAIAADGVRTTSSRITTAPYFTSYPYRDQQKILSITFLPMIKKVVDNMGSYIFTRSKSCLG